MNTNHKWLLATVFFWAIGAYFLAAGLVNQPLGWTRLLKMIGKRPPSSPDKFQGG